MGPVTDPGPSQGPPRAEPGGPRERWSSGLGFLLAATGSAVGIGNLWRFPHVVGANGGGAFLLPYLLAVVLVGLPLLATELALGRKARASLVPALARERARLALPGYAIVLLVVAILGYYLAVMGWVVAFAAWSFAGRTPHFEAFTAGLAPLPFFLLALGLTAAVVRAGVRRGIERVSKLLMPLLLVLLLVLVARALTLPGAMDGVAFYLRPDVAALADPLVWIAAFGQAFFSLGVGLGVMLTYGSYMGPEPVPRAAAQVGAADTGVALLAGLVVFPIAASFGLEPAGGVQLAFVALPRAFEAMPLGGVVAPLFFLLLAVAALTSAVSLLELPVATLVDARGWSRGRATLVASAAVLAVGLPAALSYTSLGLGLGGVRLLDLYDHLFGTVGLVVAGLALSVAFGWLADRRGLVAELGGGAWFQRLHLLALRFLIPLALGLNLLVAAVRPLPGG